MTANIQERIHAIFERALQLAEDQRSAYVSEACADDARLRAEVESLLAHNARVPEDFMRAPESTEGSKPKATSESGDHLIGRRIAAYTIRNVIGSGGMGTVYEAQQHNPKRIVALKVVRAGIASDSALRRFEHESQILARLLHRNIAQIYEAGTFRDESAGDLPLPFFAMERVPDAVSITRFARQRGLSMRDRLALFTQVCDAVQHGHQKGVIHRDLKPGNILVDSSAQVKIIDFGVARSTDSDVAATTIQTDAGQLIGTIQYMSPEQCEADPLGLDTRSDIYALGVVLYELLTGQPPYDVGNRALHSAARVICEQPPDRPSTINRKLRGDIEIVVLKALEKDREKRYASAAELGEEIDRFLRREPIEAKAPTVLTRLLRWATRHQAQATAVLCLLIAVSVLAATRVATSLYNSRAWDLRLSDDGREATLHALSGRVIKNWRPGEVRNGRVVLAKLVKQGGAAEEKRLAILGFQHAHGSTPFPNSLCAFNVDGDLDRPLWERHIKDDDIPEPIRLERGFAGMEFCVANGIVEDVFPERTGTEIVTVHQHGVTTHSALRVYDLKGNLLFQVWVDAQIIGMYWMREVRLLALAGFNGSAYWPKRGHTEVRRPHPSVVFAIRLEEGLIAHNYLAEKPGDDSLRPAWYKCLLPPQMSDRFNVTRRGLVRPSAKYDRGRSVQFGVHTLDMSDGKSGSMWWTLDEFGHPISGSQTTGDLYKLNQSNLPDPREVYLGPLPPIVDAGHRPPGTDPKSK